MHTKQPSIECKPLASLFAGRLHAWAGVWLFAGVTGPCAQHAPTPAAAPATVAAVPAAVGASPASSRQQTPTTRSYMLTHYADTVGMRRALVSGKLEDFQLAAAAVVKDDWTPRLRGDYRPYRDAVRAAANSARQAHSVVTGTAALAKLGEACASCHLKFGGPGSPVAPEPLSEGADPSMVAHAVATDRLWEGLVWPSDTSWSSGMEVLLDAPKLDSDVADVAQAARHLRELARKGKSAEVQQRGEIFASVLTTCAGCHERLGINVRTPSP